MDGNYRQPGFVETWAGPVGALLGFGLAVYVFLGYVLPPAIYYARRWWVWWIVP